MMMLMSFDQDSFTITNRSLAKNPDQEMTNARHMFNMLKLPVRTKNAKQLHHVMHNEQLKGLNLQPL